MSSIVPEATYSKRHKGRLKRVMIILVVILLLAAIAAAGYWYMFMKDKRTTTVTTKPTKAEELQQKIAKTTDVKEKAKLYSDLSIVQTAKDKNAALDAAKQAATIAPTADYYANLAGLYLQKGDKQAAIENYKKALALTTPTNDPTINNDYNYYKGQIMQLGGSI